jgi:phosphocarrier protein
MYSKKIKLINETGLHARPAVEFVKKARGFESEIIVKRVEDEKSADGKEAIPLLALGLDKGTEIEIAAIGIDEVEAIDSLIQLVKVGCGELV